MLNIIVDDLELFVMEDQIHLTITGTVCAAVIAVVYWSFSSREAQIAEEVAMEPNEAVIYTKDDWTSPRTGVVCFVVANIFYALRVINHTYFDQIEAMIRKMTGLQSGEKKSPHPPIQLGPHSYQTLGLSILSCVIFLAIIWLIKMVRLDKLYKSSLLYKLVKILTNSPDLELEEDGADTSEQLAARQRVLDTCIELERRMTRLEQSIAPLARSLQVLTDHIESRSEHSQAEEADPRDLDEDHESQVPRMIDSKVQDYLISLDDLDSQVVDMLARLNPKNDSDPQVPDFRESKIGDSVDAAELVDFRSSDVQDIKIKESQDSSVRGPVKNQKSVHSAPQFTYLSKLPSLNQNLSC